MGNGRIVVLGAGLIGCYIGGRLTRTGPVTLLGRDALMAELATHGLWLGDLKGARVAADRRHLSVSTSSCTLSDAALVLVSVKSAATADAALQIAVHSPFATPVVSLQNGVGNLETLRALLPGRTVLGGMVPFNVARRAPGYFHRGTSGDLVVENHPAFAPWCDRFAAAGLPVVLAEDMAAVSWGKVLINLNNAVNALSGLPLAAQLADRDFRRAWSMALREALAVLKAAGIAPAAYNGRPLWMLARILLLPDGLFRRLAWQKSGAAVDRYARSSMADDLAAGKPTEIDHINGAVVALATRLGLSAPINARLVELVHAAERGAAPIGGAALRRDVSTARAR